ncbi:MAG TPA: non-heme iron oxygenase ferredoxin subunit [Actinomycetota bacterium]|nr:non-heme iron oxygenase ferredoxin subunit [Actinomycetota bacterium]
MRVGALGEVPEGELRAYETALGRVAVARLEERLFAVSDECTHAGCSLADGGLDEDELAVECPCHGSAFDLGSGEPVRGPARDPLTVYPVRTDAGWIEIGPPEG